MANNQSVGRHLDAFTRGRIIRKLEEGRSVTSVAAEFGIAHSIVSRLCRQFQTTGTAIRGFSSGRPRGTTPANERYIVLQARRNRRQTAGEIARHSTQATGRPISRFTVARRLHDGGLFARRPVRCVPLTPAHRRRRSLWCREHRNWRDNEWGRVLFTDESRFSLSSDSHRILIWRERGSRNHPSNIIERDRYGGRGVLVWGGIMLGSRTELHILYAVSVNGTRYCNEILLPYVRLFRGAMGLQFLFMDDNAPCYRTVASEQLLESEDIERMDWPARSPDLNPIEHKRGAWQTGKKFEDAELQVLLDEDDGKTQEHLAEQLNANQSTVSRRLKAMGKIIKVGRRGPHELTDRQQGNRKFACEMLLVRYKRKSYLHCIVTGDEKWIYFDNRKRNRLYVDPRQPSKSTARKIGSRIGRNQTTVMRICDRWIQEGTTDRRGQSHPPQCTTSREDRQIARMAVTDLSVTSRTVAHHIESVTHHSVSARTIRRRLQQSGLSARHPFLGLPLTQNHRCLRHQWCDERRM
ncbi:mariner Mos1 transposase [Trichonephila clavipes]|uniref:Mariner Mos1 transposase n=1 Tax=Trichonephila clavipes TaxID=2585209 RepID=A0A8X6RSF4_TRICX|nr:mariner Mos1 transposase [Trichonephila clavipes]